MRKIPSFLVISRYKEDYSWVGKYTDKYIVFNKGEPIFDDNVRNVPNIGGNQRDICQFIYENYENLPYLMAFVQGYPFDHCRKDIFDRIIYNNFFTSLEYYGEYPANNFEARDSDGGFMEMNNNWYIYAHNSTYELTCKYASFDEFMNKYFLNYQPLSFIRFSPGSQYIVEKKQALQYPRDFWKSLMDELPKNNMTEGHIIERALWHILNGTYKLRENI